MIAPGGTEVSTGVRVRIRVEIPQPNTRPLMAPMAVRVVASTRNCQRITRRVAPIALRTPISRVRSVTEIIMIATTPTPPTINPTADRTNITRKNTPVSRFHVSNSLSCVMIAKSLGRPGRRPRMARSTAVTSSMVASRSSVLGFTVRSAHSVFAFR